MPTAPRSKRSRNWAWPKRFSPVAIGICQRLGKGGVAIGVVGADWLLEPVAAELLVDLAAPERLGHRKDLVGVDHDQVSGIEHGADGLDAGDILLQRR